MFARGRASRVPDELRRAYAAFQDVATRIEEATATLLLGVPSGRSPRLPLAEALAGFEQGLREAHEAMPSWRAEDVEAEWAACLAALGEATTRAERLRLEVPTDAYEEIVSFLDGLLDPLDAFGAAASRFRSLGA